MRPERASLRPAFVRLTTASSAQGCLSLSDARSRTRPPFATGNLARLQAGTKELANEFAVAPFLFAPVCKALGCPRCLRVAISLASRRRDGLRDAIAVIAAEAVSDFGKCSSRRSPVASLP